ncbi:MAG TPA: N-acetylmuramic acid 6-phosphate etherase [Rhizomicrobium sp.]|nr:N-acetylmuramic acid 6-phosphate etherase [Rhizomicrobium sp.]
MTKPEDNVRMLTERVSARYVDLDSWPIKDMLAAMYEGQLAAVAAVRPVLSDIAAAVEDAASALGHSGRLIYVGAGTSGRIGVQDGTELTPTFDWPPERLLFLMAGGFGALVQSVEGAEDSEVEGARAAADGSVGPDDVVIGVAASGTTPYTIGALREAGGAGAVTIAIASNPGAPLLAVAKHPILIKTGAEAIAGSTRMKAGTAQKIVLNLFSTALMVKLGRVYRGLMVHMRATNAKLRRRAEAIVREIVGCNEAEASRFVEQADGDLKLAVLLGLGADAANASAALARREGNLRLAIADIARHD